MSTRKRGNNRKKGTRGRTQKGGSGFLDKLKSWVGFSQDPSPSQEDPKPSAETTPSPSPLPRLSGGNRRRKKRRT